MHTINSQSVLIAVAIEFIGLAIWLNYRKKWPERLQDRFGPEYNRTVEDRISQTEAESELTAHQRRVEPLDIVPLTVPEAGRSIRSWYGLQGRFINNPQNVVAQADQLVREVMQRRGYPMEDFERRAADISVDHPAVVHNYRAAQAIAARADRGQATIEDLRQAVVYYRALFDELLEAKEATQATPGVLPESHMAVHS